MAAEQAQWMTIEHAQTAFDLAATIERLDLLDDLWTTCAPVEDADDGSPNRRGLERVVREMQLLLSEIADAAPALAGMIEQVGEERLQDTARAMLVRVPHGDELQAILDRHLAGRPLAAVAAEGCLYLAEHGAQEADELERQLDAILAGELAPGDLKVPFKCR
jgi:hypothetical protein